MPMRRRFKVLSTAIACVSAATLGGAIAACVSSNNPPPASSPDGAPPNDDATFPPAPDAGADVVVAPVDAGADTAADASDAGVGPAPDAADAADTACAPISVAGFVPPAYVPASGSIQLACQTTAQLTAQEGLYTSCFGAGATSATCDTFDGGEGGAGCVACINTQETDPTYGPVVERVVPTLNIAGCIQLADPSDAGVSCAHAIQAAEACAEAACKSVCPVTDLPSQTAYLACTNAAAAGGCATYAQAAAACAGVELGDGGTGPAGGNCFGASEQTEYGAVSIFFCGS
jgi:hypothetical protein